MLKVLVHDMHGRTIAYSPTEVESLTAKGWKVDEALSIEMATGNKPESAPVEPIRKTLSLRK